MPPQPPERHRQEPKSRQNSDESKASNYTRCFRCAQFSSPTRHLESAKLESDRQAHQNQPPRGSDHDVQVQEKQPSHRWQTQLQANCADVIVTRRFQNRLPAPDNDLGVGQEKVYPIPGVDGGLRNGFGERRGVSPPVLPPQRLRPSSKAQPAGSRPMRVT